MPADLHVKSSQTQFCSFSEVRNCLTTAYFYRVFRHMESSIRGKDIGCRVWWAGLPILFEPPISQQEHGPHSLRGVPLGTRFLVLICKAGLITASLRAFRPGQWDDGLTILDLFTFLHWNVLFSACGSSHVLPLCLEHATAFSQLRTHAVLAFIPLSGLSL